MTIYTVNSFPPVKRAFVNGKAINYAFYADTKRGFVRHYDDPPKMHKHGKRLITRTTYGVVTVEFLPGGIRT
jgi:hypothetical protein